MELRLKDSQRIGYLDCLRVFAILMIIALHSPLPASDTSSILLSCISFFNASGLTLFFMISGALLLSKKYDYKTFLKRRFGKVAWPTLFWSLFYLLDNWLQGKIGLADLTKSILSIPFGAQGNGVLWFMYTLMGLYLITPILSSWLSKASKKDVETILILWCITLLLPLLGEILPIGGEIGNNHILFYLSGYMGYYILGHYLERYYQQIRIVCILPLIVIPTMIAIVVKLLGMAVDFYKFFWYLSINVAMMSAFWFLLAKRIFTFSIPKAIYTISKYSFGIYLVHIFIMRRIVWNWNFVTQHGSAFQILTTTILTFVMSYIIVYIISRFPFSKYIIGVK